MNSLGLGRLQFIHFNWPESQHQAEQCLPQIVLLSSECSFVADNYTSKPKVSGLIRPDYGGICL